MGAISCDSSLKINDSVLAVNYVALNGSLLAIRVFTLEQTHQWLSLLSDQCGSTPDR